MENKVDTELTGLIDVFVLSMEIYKLDWMELENGDGNLVGKQRKGDLFFLSFDLAGTHYGTFAPALGFASAFGCGWAVDVGSRTRGSAAGQEASVFGSDGSSAFGFSLSFFFHFRQGNKEISI
jgi:hypothetical protein